VAPLLDALERWGRPLFVHPGPARPAQLPEAGAAAATGGAAAGTSAAAAAAGAAAAGGAAAGVRTSPSSTMSCCSGE
jgi:hypothetical protein